MKNLQKKMNAKISKRKLIKLIILAITCIFFECSGQNYKNHEPSGDLEVKGLAKETQSKSSNQIFNCNRKSFSKGYIKQLPVYICIPDGYSIDSAVKFSDFDKDGEDDFLALRYRLDNLNWQDGDTTYWDFYIKDQVDEKYKKHLTLNNIVPPYITDISYKYQSEHPTASEIFDLYPVVLYDHELSFQARQDTVILSYKYDDSIGKSFFFVLAEDGSNWFLKKIEYILGEVPPYWTDSERGGDEIYSELHDQLFTFYSKRPKLEVSIDKFNLVEAFRSEEMETRNIRDCFQNQFPELEEKYKSIWEFEFEPCYRNLEYPDDWKY